MQVEAHNGTAWATQAEMDYNGLGQRLSMDAAGVTAHYVLDGNRPLTAESGGNTTNPASGSNAPPLCDFWVGQERPMLQP